MTFFPTFVDRTCTSRPALKEEYLAFLQGHVAGDLDLNGMRIVIDCAEGAAYELAPRLFASLGADVVSIHVSPDGRNINLNCGSLHPEELQHRVVAENAHLGIAFDGDADRMLLVDEGGRLMDGDYVLYILACDLKDRNSLDRDRVVATVDEQYGSRARFAGNAASISPERRWATSMCLKSWCAVADHLEASNPVISSFRRSAWPETE